VLNGQKPTRYGLSLLLIPVTRFPGRRPIERV